MLQVTSDQWLYWLNLYFWPLLRVLALISTAPILSERTVPKRVKLGLGFMITLIIAPSLPANNVPVFSTEALWLAMQQIMIGIALGFTMQFAFAAVRTAGNSSVCKWVSLSPRLLIRAAASICRYSPESSTCSPCCCFLRLTVICG